MVNKIILDYLQNNKDKYSLDALKHKIISSGYSKEEVEEAMMILGIENHSPAEMKQESVDTSSYSKWLKLAGISGILFAVFLIISSLISSFSETVSFIFIIMAMISSIFFFYGFVVLGKKYDKRLIKIVSWIFIILIVLFMLFQIINLISPGLFGDLFAKPSVVEIGTASEALDVLTGTLLIVLILFLFVLLITIILGILFGVGLIKLKDNVEYAKTTGILLIIGYSTLIIGIGVLVLIVAYIFEILLLFKASRKQGNI